MIIKKETQIRDEKVLASLRPEKYERNYDVSGLLVYGAGFCFSDDRADLRRRCKCPITFRLLLWCESDAKREIVADVLRSWKTLIWPSLRRRSGQKRVPHCAMILPAWWHFDLHHNGPVQWMNQIHHVFGHVFLSLFSVLHSQWTMPERYTLLQLLLVGKPKGSGHFFLSSHFLHLCNFKVSSLVSCLVSAEKKSTPVAIYLEEKSAEFKPVLLYANAEPWFWLEIEHNLGPFRAARDVPLSLSPSVVFLSLPAKGRRGTSVRRKNKMWLMA